MNGSPAAVTVVLSDLVGSTALGERLDPEALREVLSRYFEEMREAIEAHGGRVEKLIGDAVVAVFGPSASDDGDALRAVAAADAAQRALDELNVELERGWGVRLANRTGVCTGQLEVGREAAGARVLGGDALEIAGVLERRARPMEVLLAESTRLWVADAVEIEALDAPPGERAGAVAAYRLRRVSAPPELPPRADAARSGAQRETRRSVTVLFADARVDAGEGAAADGERRAAAMSRYFETAHAILSGHGGTVEKFIGDAVMAVFGLPRRSEDDALRAVRAADELRRAVVPLADELRGSLGVGLAVRVGVNTGRVVASDGSLGQRLATGDAVNLAARLQGAAAHGQVVIGASTLELVASSVATEPLAPLTLKGKSEPVRAFRLDSVEAGRSGAGNATPFFGREQETAVLRAALEDVGAGGGGRTAAVLGDAGLGKSRLVEEFLAEASGVARVVRGRCLSYGEGITFWPVVEIVRAAAGIAPEHTPGLARARLLRSARGVGEDVLERVAAVAGFSNAIFQVGELFWAFSAFLARLARERPLVVVIDDVHWAEETLLEMLEYLEDALSGTAVMVLTTGRPELLARRPEWATGPGRARIELEPLTREDCARVVDALLGDAGLPAAVRDQIVAGAGGNPLFLEQLLAMMVEGGTLRERDGRWELVGDPSAILIPPSIEALVAARVDELPPPERGTIEPASVIGAEFSRAAAAALADDHVRERFAHHLDALVGHRLVARVPEPDAAWDHRFAHGMIRQVVYDGLLKRVRADLHERLVEWAEANGLVQENSVEGQELAGYHLETAYRYRAELGRIDEHAVTLGRRAAARLAPAGRRALARGDMPAAASLLARASRTLPEDDPQVPRLLLQAGEAQMEAGSFDDAASSLAAAERLAGGAGDQATATAANLEHVRMAYTTGARQDDDEVAAVADRAIAARSPVGDHAGLARAWRLRAYVELTRSQWGAAERAALEMIAHARRAGDDLMAGRVLPALAAFVLCGPTPVAEGIARCEGILADVADDRRAQALVARNLAHLRAMCGDFAAAREGYRDARRVLQELGWRLDAALVSLDSGPAELLAGDAAAAEAELRGDFDALWAMGERNYVATTGALLAEALYRQDRLDEAADHARRSREIAAEGDVVTQVLWRAVEGKVLARRGRPAEGVRTCREAVRLVEVTDDLNTHADTLCDLGEALALAGHRDEWRQSLEEALSLYRRKGNVVAERRTAGALSAPGAGPRPEV